MTTRVTLISPARNAASDGIRFEAGESLSPAGLRSAQAAAGELPRTERNFASPSQRCRETAEALGLRPLTTARQAAGCDMGRWQGRTLDEVAEADPDDVARWLADAESAPHGGESVRELCARIDAWLAELVALPGRVTAVVEPDVVRAAVVCALGAPAQSLWRVDVEPLTATEFSGRSARWNVRAGRRLGGPGPGSGSDG
jgi:broad specificity phosphatase PhoE